MMRAKVEQGAIGVLVGLGAGIRDWRGVAALVAGFVALLVWALVVVSSDRLTDNLRRLLGRDRAGPDSG